MTSEEGETALISTMRLLYPVFLVVIACNPSPASNSRRTDRYGPNSSPGRRLRGGVRPVVVLTVDYPEIVAVNISVETGKSFGLNFYVPGK